MDRCLWHEQRSFLRTAEGVGDPVGRSAVCSTSITHPSPAICVVNHTWDELKHTRLPGCELPESLLAAHKTAYAAVFVSADRSNLHHSDTSGRHRERRRGSH